MTRLKIAYLSIPTIAVALLGFTFAKSADASTVVVGAHLGAYVKPLSRNCNINVPSNFSSIQSAVDAALPGDSICVAPGVYNEDVLINKSIKLYGNGFGGLKHSVINGLGAYGAVQVDAQNVIVEGFEVHGAPSDASNAAVLIYEGSSNLVLKFNKIAASAGSNVLSTEAAQNNILIKNNVFEANNSPYIASVSGTPLDPSKPSNIVNFINNTFKGSSDLGLETAATNSLVQYNNFETTASSGVLIVYDYGSGAGNVMYNNFNSPALAKVYVSVGTLNAKNNWWGDTDPSDNIIHDVIYIPFALQPFQTTKW